MHSSHLVNMNFIKSYNKSKDGFVTLADHSSVEISSRRKDDFLKKPVGCDLHINRYDSLPG
ncbi:MAG: hypothetical protein ABI863_12200 [Ginsengibacter sp.]